MLHHVEDVSHDVEDSIRHVEDMLRHVEDMLRRRKTSSTFRKLPDMFRKVYQYIADYQIIDRDKVFKNKGAATIHAAALLFLGYN